MGTVEIEHAVVYYEIRAVALVENTDGRVTVDAVHLLVGSTGEQTDFQRVGRSGMELPMGCDIAESQHEQHNDLL